MYRERYFTHFLIFTRDDIDATMSLIRDYHRKVSFFDQRAIMARIMSPAFSAWSAMEPTVSASRTT